MVWSAAFGLLFACQATEQGFNPEGRKFGPGVDASRSTVDPLTVGHRMMEAQEYELALKSYLRAASKQGLTAPILASIGTANIGLARLGQAERNLRDATKLDETYVPGWNNLGVVLMEKRNWGEAARVFKIAFALDSGQSVEIRENLRRALANLNRQVYKDPEEPAFDLVARGAGDYLLMSTE